MDFLKENIYMKHSGRIFFKKKMARSKNDFFPLMENKKRINYAI